MPIALTPDQLALQASIRDWAKQAVPLAAVRALESGPPAGVADLGVFSIAIPEAIAGGTTQILLNQVGERVLGLPR